MDKQSIAQYTNSFNQIATYIEGDSEEKVEVWFARELQPQLGYARWENFEAAVFRAMDSCKSQNISVEDHFREVTKMIEIGKAAIATSDEKKIEKSTSKLPKQS